MNRTYKRLLRLTPLLVLLLAAGCNKSRSIYDLEKGVDPEVTLFGKSLVVPVGSAGPFTLELAKEPLGGFLTDLGLPEGTLSADENGLVLFSMKEEVFSENLYKLALSMEDNQEPYLWEPYLGSNSPLLSVLLSYLSIHTHNQRIDLFASSSMRDAIPVRGSLELMCLDEEYETCFTDAMDLDVKLPSYGSEQLLGSFQLPESLTDAIPYVSFPELTVTLPARFRRRIVEDGTFYVQLQYGTNVSLGEGFSIPLPDISIPVNLPLGGIGFNHAEIKLELESTLPLRLTIEKLSVPDNENLSITADGVLEGGSESSPVTSGLTLHIQSRDGEPIPDINTLVLSGELAAAPGMEDIPLSFNQGFYLKHSSIKVVGGINLFGHED